MLVDVAIDFIQAVCLIHNEDKLTLDAKLLKMFDVTSEYLNWIYAHGGYFERLFLGNVDTIIFQE